MSEQEILNGLARAKDGLEKYQRIQDTVARCDVSGDKKFQRMFNAFYRVRRGPEWQEPFYRLMEQMKQESVRFETVLTKLHELTGRYEASFSSKLVATLEPNKPVIDRFVISNFGLRLPAVTKGNRLVELIEVYAELVESYAELVNDEKGRLICTLFDRTYPDSKITPLKKIDLVLWQHRPETAKGSKGATEVQ